MEIANSGLWDPAYIFFSGGTWIQYPFIPDKTYLGGGGGGGGREGKNLAQTKGDMLCILVLTCFVLFSLFESDDRRFALLSPIKFIASATWM